MLGVVFFLHIAAACLWLGHMFFWSIIAGPALKKIDPPETAGRLRELSMRMGGLGWPALTVLVLTGVYLLSARGIGVGDLFSSSLRATQFGQILLVKLVLVAGMIVYQATMGHRRAPRAIYLNMLAALLIVAASVVVAGR
jgi:uncharacterized membrane protein